MAQKLKVIQGFRPLTILQRLVVITCILITMFIVFYLVVIDSKDICLLQRQVNQDERKLSYETFKHLEQEVDSALSKYEPQVNRSRKLEEVGLILKILSSAAAVDPVPTDNQNVHPIEELLLRFKLISLNYYRSILQGRFFKKVSFSHQLSRWITSYFDKLDSIGLGLFSLLFIKVASFLFRIMKLYIGFAAAFRSVLCVVFFVVLFFIPGNLLYRPFKNRMFGLLKHQVVDTEEYFNLDITRQKSEERESAPYFITKIERYSMEDVVFECWLRVSSADLAHGIFHSFWWAKKSRRLSAHDKGQINITIHNNPKGSSFLIRSTLTLELLQEGDFANYSCGYNKPQKEKVHAIRADSFSDYRNLKRNDAVATNYKLYNTPLEAPKGKAVEETFAVFSLVRMPSLLRPMKVVPGGIFIDYVPYWSLSPTRHIQFNDTIWGIDNFSCCSKFAQLFWMIYGFKDLIWKDKFGPHFRYLIRQQCICKEDFTGRNYVFSRLRYDVTRKKYQEVNIPFPQPWVFIPRLIDPVKNFFTQDENETLWTNREHLSCLKSNKASTVCRQRATLIDNYFNTAEMFNILYFLLVLVGLIASGVVCFCYLRSLLNWVFVPITKVFTISNSGVRFGYDIYLTYDENDRYDRLLARCICQHVNKGQMGPYTRIFDTCRDIPYGTPWISETEKAIEQSHSFLILASADFLQDDQKKLELETIKSASVDQNVSSFNGARPIFVLKTEQCSMQKSNLISCMSIPNNSREKVQIHQYVLDDLLEWVLRRCRSKSDVILKLPFRKRLHFHGFTLRSVVVLCLWFVLLIINLYLTTCCFDLPMAFRRIFFAPYSSTS